MKTTVSAQRTVLETFPAAQRTQGHDTRVVMDLGSDQFLVITDTPPAP
ncbi:hypothetical protein ACIPJQ_38620 [Streptomyces griseoviridis]